MTKDELCKKLNDLQLNNDREQAHITADNLLLDYIADQDIADLYNAIYKWYA